MNRREQLNENLARVSATMAALTGLAEQENRALTDEEQAQFNAHNTEFQRTEQEISNLDRVEEISARMSQPRPRVVQPVDMTSSTQAPRPAVQTVTGGTHISASHGNHGFTRGLPEFLNAVRSAAYGRTDQRLINAVTTYGAEGTGTDGGFAVPPDFANRISQVVMGEESLVGRFNPITTAGNQIVLPTDESTPYGAAGIYAEWLGEASTLTARKPQLKEVTVTLNKVGALVHLSDELAADAPAIQSYVTTKVAQAIAGKVNDAIVNGDGVSKPKGLLTAANHITQAKSGATLAAVDIANMLSRMVPESVNNCFWLCHSSFLPKVWTLTLGQMPIFVSDFRQSPYGTILGRPVVVTEYAQDYNTDGDVMLVSPDGYVVAVKSGGISTAASIHFAFDQGLQSFRATMRVGGAPLASAAVSRKNGSTTLSHIITLQARS
jgi:HK97 family phage major capsid protein